MLKIIYSLLLLACIDCIAAITLSLEQEYLEIARLNFTELAAKYGLPCVEYRVVTEDGYVLRVFHVPGDRRRPAVLVHGLHGAADEFLARGRTAAAGRLAAAGHDLWLPNVRGNKYSRAHRTLVPDMHPAFWDFSFHHHAVYDLPAVIDFVLTKTGQTRLNLIGFSQGTLMTFILASEKPWYVPKIKSFVALSPCAYYGNLQSPYKELFLWHKVINYFLMRTGQEEIAGHYSTGKQYITSFCSHKINYPTCYNNLFSMVGYDPEEYELEFAPVIFEHMLTGTSRTNLMHYAQLGSSGRFQKFDYGLWRNLAKYRSVQPPEYDLSKSTMKTYLVSSKNDKAAPPRNVAALRRALPRVAAHRVLDSPTFNHLGFVWGRTGHQITNDYILQILEQN